MDLVDTFYQCFLLFDDSAMLVGLKIGEQAFDEPGVDPVLGRFSPYGLSVLDDTQEIKIERRGRYDDKVCG